MTKSAKRAIRTQCSLHIIDNALNASSESYGNHTKFSILLVAEKNETFPSRIESAIQRCFMMASRMLDHERGPYDSVSQHDD